MKNVLTSQRLNVGYFSLQVCLLLELAVHANSMAQCPEFTNVRFSFSMTPTASYATSSSGAFVGKYNTTLDGRSSVLSADWLDRRIARTLPLSRGTTLAGRVPMADPTILYVDGNYYTTGTCDNLLTANFAIYRSSNLQTWVFYSYAFPENYQGGRTVPEPDGNTINGRTFWNLHAPQLYRDPADVNTIWLAFSATEGVDDLHFQTLYISGVKKNSFLSSTRSNRYFANPANMRAAEPLRFGYKVSNNNAAVVTYDGGYAQSSSSSITIPCSGTSQTGSNCGDVGRVGEFYEFRCKGPRTWMSIDPFIYFDQYPGAQSRRWMLYGWHQITGNASSDGNHVAAYPMFSNSLMDASAFGTSNHFQLAFRHCSNVRTLPNSTPFEDGHVCSDGDELAASGVAESPSAFTHQIGTTTYSYVIYSRNVWNSPGYDVVYRKAIGSFANLAEQWNSANVAERSLIVRQPLVPEGQSYGGAEIFYGPGNRPYIIFHEKQPSSGIVDPGNPLDPCDDILRFPDGFSGRTIFIKELHFYEQDTYDAFGILLGQAGDILPISKDYNGCATPASLHGFLAPR